MASLPGMVMLAGGCPYRIPVGKGNKVVRDEKGRKRKERLYFYGYKEHVSMNAQCGLVTSLRPSPGSAYDGHYLSPLVESDLDQGIPVGVAAANAQTFFDSGSRRYSASRGCASRRVSQTSVAHRAGRLFSAFWPPLTNLLFLFLSRLVASELLGSF